MSPANQAKSGQDDIPWGFDELCGQEAFPTGTQQATHPTGLL